MLETIGLLLFSSLFIFSGLTHLLKSSDMVAYTTAAFGDCPLAKQFGFLGGWPTGVFLTIFGVSAAFGTASWPFYGLAAFLFLMQGIFHRSLKDPANLKHLSLLGLVLAYATTI